MPLVEWPTRNNNNYPLTHDKKGLAAMRALRAFMGQTTPHKVTGASLFVYCLTFLGFL